MSPRRTPRVVLFSCDLLRGAKIGRTVVEKTSPPARYVHSVESLLFIGELKMELALGVGPGPPRVLDRMCAFPEGAVIVYELARGIAPTTTSPKALVSDRR